MVLWHKRQPELKVADVSKLLGERWRNMDPNQRAKYEAKSAADKERWKKEMKAYHDFVIDFINSRINSRGAGAYV